MRLPMVLSAHCNVINNLNERLTGERLSKAEIVPSPNEMAKDRAVVIVTMTYNVLRHAGRCILKIPVNITSVCCDGWAVCGR